MSKEAFDWASHLLSEREVSEQQEADYMSDMQNWCVVHATKYMPLKNANGTMYIPSTAMATGFKIPRSTIHFTLNRVTSELGDNSWDDTSIVVLAPYGDITKQNGNPAEIAKDDTYWSADPDTGLVLPGTAFIIKPDNNGPLFQIGEHVATYKNDNYSDEEIAQIESLLTPADRIKYEIYKNADLQSWDIENELESGDKRVRSLYDGATDKKAFLRGLFEESRFTILSNYLRDGVARLVMNKMGYKCIGVSGDGSRISSSIEKIAVAYGIPSKGSDHGHNDSVYTWIEGMYLDDISHAFNGYGWRSSYGIYTAPDMTSLYMWFLKNKEKPIAKMIISNLIENNPIDFAALYNDVYADNIKRKIEYAKRPLESDADQDELLNKATKWSARKTIADYDKNLAETIRRHVDQLNAQYSVWRNDLAKQRGFDEMVCRLRELVAPEYVQSRGRGGR